MQLDLNALSELTVASEPISISTDLTMIKRMISDIKFDSIDNDETSQMLASTDIIPSVYEGGFKTWECCLDLIRHLNFELFNGRNVLELGCGSGLPGIFALMNGAKVTFQDYNLQVLSLSTLPNALLNTSKSVEKDLQNGIFQHSLSVTNLNAEFWAGDWESLSEEWINHEKFDFILTSETIYEYAYYSSLSKLIDLCLCKGGQVWIAAKSQYFGCSGSTTSFMHHFSQNYPEWNVSIEFLSSDGIRREIIQLTKPS